MFQIIREKEMALHDANAATPGGRYSSSRPRGPNLKDAQQRKQIAAERIGIGRPRP